MDARRELFQIKGKFVLEDEGHPKQLSDVGSILPVDLEPAIFPTIDLGEFRYTFEPALAITPELDEETKQYFGAEIPDLGIVACGRTRDELFDDVNAQIAFVWTEYVLAEDATLSDDAIELKNRVRERVKRSLRGKNRDDGFSSAPGASC